MFGELLGSMMYHSQLLPTVSVSEYCEEPEVTLLEYYLLDKLCQVFNRDKTGLL